MKRSHHTVLLILGLVGSPWAAEIPNRTPYDGIWEASLKSGQVLELSCDLPSQPAAADATVTYSVTVTNLSDRAQGVALSLKPDRWAVMPVVIVPQRLELVSGQQRVCVVKVTCVDKLPKGAHERHVVVATPDDPYPCETLELVTVRALSHPFMMVDDSLIAEIKQKIDRNDWARLNFEALKRRANRWVAPVVQERSIQRAGVTWKGLLPNDCAERAWEVAVAGVLTGADTYRAPLLAFLRSVANSETGYVTTRWATDSDAYLYEGEFFTYYSALYDVLHDDPGLTAADHADIRRTLRLYLDTCKSWHRQGDIGNGVVAANAGAICSSAVLQDMVSLEYFLNCDKGFKEQLGLGVMGDGWWYEGAANDSYRVARHYSYAAQSVRALGINLFDMHVPVRYLGEQGRRWKNGRLGMNFDVWGPPGKSYRCLKDLYDGATLLMDEHGRVAANNDSEPETPGDVFELGYHHYRDPTYLWILNRAQRDSWQSLVYGVGRIPDRPDPRSLSGHVDNVGIAALRSQQRDQQPDEQIQAFLKWGTHGGWQGHFDRVSLLQLRRYGQDLLLPRPSRFGDSSPLYKSWIQSSISHNMVIVDAFQQEPVESALLMFHAGQALQAAAVETRARWVQKLPWNPNDPGDLDAANVKKMVDYGTAEPVLQRRLMVVTDDAVVLFDYLEGRQDHLFDWLIHPVGFVETEGLFVQKTQRTERVSDDPNSSYYPMTDCQWFQVTGPVVNRFKDGRVTLNVHTAFEGVRKMAVATYPEGIERPVSRQRKTLLFRDTGNRAVFTSLLEPYLKQPRVKSFTLHDQGQAEILLQDGRRQVLEVTGLENADMTPKVVFREYQAGSIVREETTK